MASLDPKTAEQITKRPRYIETVGEACPLSVTRINREPVEGESVGRITSSHASPSTSTSQTVMPSRQRL